MIWIGNLGTRWKGKSSHYVSTRQTQFSQQLLVLRVAPSPKCSCTARSYNGNFNCNCLSGNGRTTTTCHTSTFNNGSITISRWRQSTSSCLRCVWSEAGPRAQLNISAFRRYFYQNIWNFLCFELIFTRGSIAYYAQSVLSTIYERISNNLFLLQLTYRAGQ